LENSSEKLIFNLNSNKKKEFKKEPVRKINAKFSQHIPYLKTLSFRVELTNKKTTDFNEDIVWDVELHH
jgi:hypothetical protein